MMFYALSCALKFEQNVGCFVWGSKNGIGCFVRGGGGDKNSIECFVRGGKSCRMFFPGVKNILGCFVPFRMFCPTFHNNTANVGQNITGQSIPCHFLTPQAKHSTSICQPGENIPLLFLSPRQNIPCHFKTSHAISTTPDKTSHFLFKAFESA